MILEAHQGLRTCDDLSHRIQCSFEGFPHLQIQDQGDDIVQDLSAYTFRRPFAEGQ